MQLDSDSVTSLSPSFNTYSNTNLAEIAARVAEEFNPDEFHDEFYFERQQNPEHVEKEGTISDLPEEDTNEDEEFEFAFVTRDSESFSPISADEIFQNGQIRPVYPVFNRNLFLKHMELQNGDENENGVVNRGSAKAPTIRLPLRRLFSEERETTMTTTTSSSSSSEADDLDGVPAETYCVWRPEAAAEGRCKKSSSAGSSSKRWKFKDLMNRSHSDGGKGSFVFLAPSNSGRKRENEEKVKETPPVAAGKVKSAAAAPMYSGEKRRSYLPYRQDLVGLFSNVNGLSKNLHPF
ncbi:hypothetical protein BUALT_Bualt07G0033500 [Buddleja alternifolia]|uniref:Uncharacterized protein n=1 Tax=Buddleja alternifolia TaxID=168488 RepID=A0AAV6XII4_9LAMI|nr:hypothetical protein BUALT_Bualt07G0033500 [Buddleja alternifolia]